jgi:hypothetical protein
MIRVDEACAATGGASKQAAAARTDSRLSMEPPDAETGTLVVDAKVGLSPTVGNQ